MNTIIAGLALAAGGAYLWYYCHREAFLEAAAKRLLIHRAGLIAMRAAEVEAEKMDARLEIGGLGR